MADHPRRYTGRGATGPPPHLPVTDDEHARCRDGLVLADICASRDYCGPANAHGQHGGVELPCRCVDTDRRPYA